MKYNLSGTKALIFDFDGVILDSEEYKLQSYPKLFTEYHEKMEDIKKYIKGAAGVQRFKKFKDIYDILGLEYTEDAGKRLSENYDKLTLDSLKKLPLVNGVEDFLKSSTCKNFVASSTPVDILNDIIKTKKIERYFTQIFGFPVSKTEAIESVENEYGIEAREITFFGDAIADFNAARKMQVDFIGVGNLTEFEAGTKQIKDFTELTQ